MSVFKITYPNQNALSENQTKRWITISNCVLISKVLFYFMLRIYCLQHELRSIVIHTNISLKKLFFNVFREPRIPEGIFGKVPRAGRDLADNGVTVG